MGADRERNEFPGQVEIDNRGQFTSLPKRRHGARVDGVRVAKPFADYGHLKPPLMHVHGDHQERVGASAWRGGSKRASLVV